MLPPVLPAWICCHQAGAAVRILMSCLCSTAAGWWCDDNSKRISLHRTRGRKGTQRSWCPQIKLTLQAGGTLAH